MFLRKTQNTGSSSNSSGYFFIIALLILTIKLITLYVVNPSLSASEIITSSQSLFQSDCDFIVRLQTTLIYFFTALSAYLILRKDKVLANITAIMILLWPTATYTGLLILEPTSVAHVSTFLLAPLTAFLICKFKLIRLSKIILSTLFVGLIGFSISSYYFYKNNNPAFENFDFMIENKHSSHFVEGVKVYLNFGLEKKVYIEEYSHFLTSKRYVKNADIIHAKGEKPDPQTLYITNIRSTENDLIQKFSMNFEYSGTIDYEPYENVRFVSTVYMVSEIKTEDKPNNAAE